MKKPLSAFIREYSARNKNEACSAVYSVTNSHGFMPSTEYFSKEVFSKDLSAYKIVKKGMIAYNPSRINVGSVAVQRAAEQVIVSPLYVVFEVNEKELLPEYVSYFLHSDIGLAQIAMNTSGSVRDSLKFNALQKIEINVYSVEEQRRVVDKLQRLEAIILKKRKVLEKFEDLVKSQFIEMFGNPITNSQNRPTKLFIDVVKLQRGYDLPVQDRVEGVVPVYGSNGILSYHNDSRAEDGIITGRSGTIGKVYFCRGEFWPLNTTLYSVDKHGNNPVFLTALLQFFDLSRFYNGTGVPTLNRNIVHKERIIVIPRKEQDRFAAFVEQTDKSKIPYEMEVAV